MLDRIDFDPVQHPTAGPGCLRPGPASEYGADHATWCVFHQPGGQGYRQIQGNPILFDQHI
jgi:hypothetical protein